MVKFIFLNSKKDHSSLSSQPRSVLIFRSILLVSVAFILSVLPVRVIKAEPLFYEGSSRVSQKISIPDFADLAKKLCDSVVNVSVEGSTKKPGEGEETLPESQLRSVGSGFIINKEGFIITNFHVVNGAKRVVVRLKDDKREYKAEIIGSDQKTDLALLKINAQKQLLPVTLGDSDVIEVGEWVVAIGNQFQLGHTVTAGIVSAKSRKVPNRGSPYDSFIQTDASINPGSSGGPLFNTKGEVVGINSAIFSPGRPQGGSSGFNIGIGFAIPINLAKGVVTQLHGDGKVTRGVLGVIIQEVSESVAQVLGLKSNDGALVADIVSGSPAAKAGLQRFDVITSFDGREVKDFDDLPPLVASTSIGSSIKIDFIRDGKTNSVSVKIDELKESSEKEVDQPLRYDELGLLLENLTPELSRSFGIQEGNGALITGIQSGSRAERAGLIRGDILIAAGKYSIQVVEDLERILMTAEKSKPILLAVRRRDGVRIFTLPPND